MCIRDSRYYRGTGKYSEIPDIRDVTIIEKEVLDALEEKGESLESISLERETIQTLIDRSKKD